MKKITRAQMVFTESFKKPQLKKLKEAAVVLTLLIR